MTLISPEGLQGAYEVYADILEALEENRTYQITCLGEPQLGKRGLYATISQKNFYGKQHALMDFIAYADGQNDLIAISDRIGVPVKELLPIVEKLRQSGLLTEK